MYVVKDWDKYYENNRSRDIKAPQWVPIPNKHDGDGYTQLMEEDDSGALYGAWIAIVALASKCEKRGTLLRSDGTPHDAASISRITRINRVTTQKALDFCSNMLKWLIYISPHEGAGLPQEGVLNGRELNGIEGNGIEHKNACESEDSKAVNEPKRFVKPTLQEVTDHCLKIKASIDPEKFIAYYDSKGWVVGKSPMKNWKAAIRTWEIKRKNYSAVEKPEAPLTDIHKIGFVLQGESFSTVRTLADELGYGRVVIHFQNKAPDLKGECYRTFLARLKVMLEGRPDAKTQDAVDHLESLAKSWVAYWQKERTESKYIPSLANFFNGSKYMGFPE